MASEIDLAVDRTVRKYGFTAMAKALGQSPNYFFNKASAGYEGAHLSPKELVAVANQADDYDIFHTFGRELNRAHVGVELNDYQQVSDTELLDIHLKLQEEQGQTAALIREAISKGQISSDAFREINREFHEDVQVMFELRARLEGLVR